MIEGLDNFAKRRFWNYVDKKSDDECWEWKGGINSTKRGIFTIRNKSYKAHRISWIINIGEIPNGLCVCHHCDNGKCVNPKHLFLGTQKDNVYDMLSKNRGRVLCGDDDPKSKLTSKQVLRIRKIYEKMEATQYELAKEFGVSRSCIESVINYYTWKHI